MVDMLCHQYISGIICNVTLLAPSRSHFVYGPLSLDMSLLIIVII